MKVLIIVIAIVVIIVIIYIVFIKMYSKNAEKRVVKLLFEDNLNKTKIEIEKEIKKRKIEYISKTIERYKYNRKYYDVIFVNTNSNNTLIIYFFDEDKCVGFLVQTTEDRYSLPYWKYFKPFNKENDTSWMKEGEAAILLARYTEEKMFENYQNDLEFSKNNLEFHFGSYYKINMNRFVSISFEKPQIFPRSKYLVNLYLCTTKLAYYESIRKLLAEKYTEWQLPYITDLKKLNNYIENENSTI